MSFTAVLAGVMVVGLSTPVPAHAGRVVAVQACGTGAVTLSCTPDTGTPHFPATTRSVEQVRQLVQCGSLMYAVGTFSTVRQGGKSFTRHNVFSFKAAPPFTITKWSPRVNGEVNTIDFSNGNCADAYIGGKFNMIGRTRVSNIAEITTGTGSVVTAFQNSGTFKHSANGQVETIASYQDHLLVGGYFTMISNSGADKYMVSLNPTTGLNDGFLHLNISGRYLYPGVVKDVTRVYNQQLSHGGTLDLVEGVFTSVGGRHRRQIFMLNLASRPTATVTGWTSPRFDGSKGYPPKGDYYNCTDREPFYIRTAAWSPDDQTVYLASTGFRPWNFKSGFPLRGLCDMAAAFTASQNGAQLKWINYTGCYSLYSAAADAHGAFFGGHELWSQSPNGCKTFHHDPNAISAPGFEGLSPSTGSLIFNPTRARGLGADDMLVTSAGLWIASDNFGGSQMCGKVNGLSGICFLPYV